MTLSRAIWLSFAALFLFVLTPAFVHAAMITWQGIRLMWIPGVILSLLFGLAGFYSIYSEMRRDQLANRKPCGFCTTSDRNRKSKIILILGLVMIALAALLLFLAEHNGRLRAANPLELLVAALGSAAQWVDFVCQPRR